MTLWSINAVDIYTEEKLKIYTNEHIIEINEKGKKKEKTNYDSKEFDLDTVTDLSSKETEKKVFSPDSLKEKPVCDFAVKINWPQKRPFQMKAQDFLNFMRDEMIKQIEIAKKETLDYYETIKEELSQNEKIKEEELKRKLFAKRLAFLYPRPYSNLNPFNLYLVVSDFYLDECQLKLLK